METKQRSAISILMFPWLAHGHVSPFLELAKRLTKRNFHIYFCSTPVNLNSIKPNLSPKYSTSIQLVELHLPSLPDLPPHYHTTKGLPPHLMPSLKKALDMASPGFLNILKNLKPDLLVHDFLQPWAPALASSLGISAVNLLSISAAMIAFTLHCFVYSLPDKFPFEAIYVEDHTRRRLDQVLESSSNDIKDMERATQSIDRSCNVILVKTFRELEGKYMDYLSILLKKKIVPVGPLVQEPIEEDGRKEVIEWLDKKKHSSTIFVSFGSEYFLSKEEREEIAHGLEISEVSFIWVIRFPVGEELKLDEALPKGFLERVQGRGLIVEDWAPQAKILAHSSIGGFVCHCGWSSIMESMKFGVPIIALPMNLDQPLNAKLVEDVGVGMEVKRTCSGDLRRDEIAKIIREVVVEKGGEEVRKKAREMGSHMRERGEEEIDGVVDELVQLCSNKIIS